MAVTTYKGAALPTVAGEDGTWGTNLNTNTFSVFDKNLGGIVSKSLTNDNVTLTESESQNAVVRLTGTLSGNVQITTECQGFHYVENLCTLGAYAVTIKNDTAATTATVPYGRHAVIFDDTNGARITGDSFASGTAMLFVQTSAPTGWTKSTTHDNKALRVVSGTASSGGTTAFTSVFAARTITTANMPAHTHEVTDPGHTHAALNLIGGSQLAGGGTYRMPDSITGSSTTEITIQSAGSGTAMDFAVQYVDVIIATKD